MTLSNSKTRLIIIVIPLLLASPRETWGQDSGTSDMASLVCQDRSRDQLESARKVLIESLRGDNLYLTFVLDVSASIDKYRVWGEIKLFTKDLVNYAISEAGVVIHPDHARVEVITFDDEAKLRVFNSTRRHIHACEFYDIIDDLSHHSRSGRTEVHVALDAAYQNFFHTRRVGGNMVLFLVTDGEFSSTEYQVRSAGMRLMHLGVQLFTVGVGYYRKDPAKEARLQRVATDAFHYLCYHQWRDEILPVQGKIQATDPVWAEVTEEQIGSRCPLCRPMTQCACAVNIPRYDCACNPDYYRGPTGNCVPCPPGSCKYGVGDSYHLCSCEGKTPALEPIIDGTGSGAGTSDNPWMLVGMVILGVVLLFVLVTLLVLLARRQKRRQGVLNFTFFSFINFMTNGKLFTDAETSAETCENAAAKTVPTPSPPVSPMSPGMTSSSAVTSVTGVSVAAIRTLYETPTVPTEDNVYEEIKTYMRDWDVHIRHLAAATDLHHLAIFDTKEEVMTCTEDFQLRACEVQHLQIVLTSGRRGEAFQLAAKAYKITSIAQNDHVTAREISLSGEKAVVCARTAGRFLVIGIGPEAAEASCAEAVSTLLTELDAAGSPTTARLTTSNPLTSDPTTSNLTTSNLTTSNPLTSNPTTSNPATSNPTTFGPTTFAPTTFATTTSNPTLYGPMTSNRTNGGTMTSNSTNAGTTTSRATSLNRTASSPKNFNPTTSNPVASGATITYPTITTGTTSSTTNPNTTSSNTTPSITTTSNASTYTPTTSTGGFIPSTITATPSGGDLETRTAVTA